MTQQSNSLASKDKEISSLKSLDSEKDSMISALQLEIGQLSDQLSILKESSDSAPTTEQFQALTQERETLKLQISSTLQDLDKSQRDFKVLQDAYTSLEKDENTTHETLVSLRNEHSKLKESHASEIQKSRLSHSRAAELQLENKTLISRVEELKHKVVTLTSQKLELGERVESLQIELFKLRKERNVAVAIGNRANVESNAELDALIQGQETRQAIRETNQHRYSQFVGQMDSNQESMKDINERRLKEGKDSGEFGREKEMGFVIDLISEGRGCGMCTGEVIVL
jgi:chromosome segregation ATPase